MNKKITHELINTLQISIILVFFKIHVNTGGRKIHYVFYFHLKNSRVINHHRISIKS